MADRALDTFPFVVLAAVTIASMALFFDFPIWLIAVMIVAVIGIVAVLVILIYMCINPSFGGRVEGWIIGLVRRFYKKNSENLEAQIHDAIFGFQDTMKILISNKKGLVLTISLSFIIWISEIVRVYLGCSVAAHQHIVEIYADFRNYGVSFRILGGCDFN